MLAIFRQFICGQGKSAGVLTSSGTSSTQIKLPIESLRRLDELYDSEMGSTHAVGGDRIARNTPLSFATTA